MLRNEAENCRAMSRNGFMLRLQVPGFLTAELSRAINPLAQLLFFSLTDKPVAPFRKVSPVVFRNNDL
jgi:hypothetical protein